MLNGFPKLHKIKTIFLSSDSNVHFKNSMIFLSDILCGSKKHAFINRYRFSVKFAFSSFAVTQRSQRLFHFHSKSEITYILFIQYFAMESEFEEHRGGIK